MTEAAHDQFGSLREIICQLAVERSLRDLRLELIHLAVQLGDATDDFVVARIGCSLCPSLQDAGLSLSEELLELLNRLGVEATLCLVELPQLVLNLKLLLSIGLTRGKEFVAARPPLLTDFAHGGQSCRVGIPILNRFDLLHEQFELGLPPRDFRRHQTRHRGEKLITLLRAREVDQIRDPLVPTPDPTTSRLRSLAILPSQQVLEQRTALIGRQFFAGTLLQLLHARFVLLQGFFRQSRLARESRELRI